MAIAAIGAGCSGAPAGTRLEVDAVEGDRVRVWAPDAGRALTLKRSALPAPIREGDVLVDGRTDPELAAELRAEVARARATLGRAERGSFELESGQAREPSSALPRRPAAPPRAEDSASLTDPVEP